MRWGSLAAAIEHTLTASPVGRNASDPARLGSSTGRHRRHWHFSTRKLEPNSLRIHQRRSSGGIGVSNVVKTSASSRSLRPTSSLTLSSGFLDDPLRNSPSRLLLKDRGVEGETRYSSHSSRALRAAGAAMGSSEGGPPEGYRPNVGVCVINEKDEVFVASRLDLPDSWQMPQGGVDEGEEPSSAAVRELREETGVTSVELIGEVPEWLTYDFPPDVKVKITKLWGREWTGQAQKWFLFRFRGDESEVNLGGEGTEPAEFGNWSWVPAEEVLRRAVEFKKPVYARAFKSLAMYIKPWSAL